MISNNVWERDHNSLRSFGQKQGEIACMCQKEGDSLVGQFGLDLILFKSYFQIQLTLITMNAQQNTSPPPVPPSDNPAIPVIVPVPGWFSYSGRYTRAQFWWKWLIAIFLLGVIFQLVSIAILEDLYNARGRLDSATYGSQFDCVIYGRIIDSALSQLIVLIVVEIVVYTLLLLPLLVKRLHDIGMSTIVAVGVWVVLQGVKIAEAAAIFEVSNDIDKYGVSYSSLMGATVKMQENMQTFTVIQGIIGLAMLFILCKDSQKGTNLYGPSSKYPDAQ